MSLINTTQKYIIMKHLFTIALALLLAGLQAQTGITVVADCVCEGNPRQVFAVTAEGTAGPFQFLWSGPEGYTSWEQNPTDIALPGQYTLKIANSYGCVFEYTASVEGCAGPGLSLAVTGQSPSYSGAATGSITVSASGGTPPYRYSWSNGAASEGGLSGLAAGLYGLTVTDAMGCERALDFVVGQ